MRLLRWNVFLFCAVVGLDLVGAAAVVLGFTEGAYALESVHALDGVAPRERQATIALVDGVPQQMRPAEYDTPTSGRCTNLTTTPVYAGSSAVSKTLSEGPWCSTCALGPTIPIAGISFAVADGAGAVLRCRFVDDGVGFTGSGGLQSGSIDGQWLRLDTSNDPLTSSLSVSQSSPTLTTPTYTTPANTDLVLAPGSGARGLTILSGTASSLGDGVLVTGTAAALSGRSSIAFSTNVSAVGDRYVSRFAAASGDVLRVAGNGALLPGGTNDGQDVGATGNAWARFFVGTSINGSTNAKALTISDAEGVQISASSGQLDVQPDGDVFAAQVTTGGAGVPVLRLPSFANSAAAAGSVTTACSSSSVGAVVVSDSNVSTSTFVCICARRAGVYAYRAIDDLATTCP